MTAPMATTIAQFENIGLRHGTGAETLSDIGFSFDGGGIHIWHCGRAAD